MSQPEAEPISPKTLSHWSSQLGAPLSQLEEALPCLKGQGLGKPEVFRIFQEKLRTKKRRTPFHASVAYSRLPEEKASKTPKKGRIITPKRGRTRPPR